MSTALVPTFYRRPPFLTVPVRASAFIYWTDGRALHGEHGDLIVSVATHDQYFLRTLSSWRRVFQLGLTPDITSQYQAWRERELLWYRQFGLLPPLRVNGGARRQAYRRATCRRGHPFDTVVERRAVRRCRTCMAESSRRQRAKAKEAR